MIQCLIVVENVAEITILGKDFTEDLARIKLTFAQQDRRFDEDRKVWVISNAQNYRHVNFIENAFRAFEAQMSLF